MNTLTGQIISIEISGSLSLLHIQVDTIVIRAIVIETPNTAPYLKKGNQVGVLFKETEVVIATKATHNNISLQNKLRGTIKKIEKGQLLSKLRIETPVGEIVSIITSSAVKELNIENATEVVAMVKINEVMLQPIL